MKVFNSFNHENLFFRKHMSLRIVLLRLLYQTASNPQWLKNNMIYFSFTLHIYCSLTGDPAPHGFTLGSKVSEKPPCKHFWLFQQRKVSSGCLHSEMLQAENEVGIWAHNSWTRTGQVTPPSLKGLRRYCPHTWLEDSQKRALHTTDNYTS